MRSSGSTSTRGGSPIFTCASGTTPSRRGANTNRRKPIVTCYTPKASRSKKARAKCRPRSVRAGAHPDRCSAPMPNTTRCRAIRSRSSPIRPRAPGCIPGPLGTPTRIRHSARPHSPGYWRRRRRWSGSASPGPCCSSASRPKRCAARSRCTPPRAITTVPTPSSPITRISPTPRSGTPSAARIGVRSSPSRRSSPRSGSTRA